MIKSAKEIYGTDDPLVQQAWEIFNEGDNSQATIDRLSGLAETASLESAIIIGALIEALIVKVPDLFNNQ